MEETFNHEDTNESKNRSSCDDWIRRLNVLVILSEGRCGRATQLSWFVVMSLVQCCFGWWVLFIQFMYFLVYIAAMKYKFFYWFFVFPSANGFLFMYIDLWNFQEHPHAQMENSIVGMWVIPHFNCSLPEWTMVFVVRIVNLSFSLSFSSCTLLVIFKGELTKQKQQQLQEE